MTSLSVAQRNAHADLAADAVDGGGAAGYLEVYTGSQPATVATAPTGTLLVTVTFNFPAYGAAGAAVDGVADLEVGTPPEGMPVADGTPGYFRAYTSAGTALRDTTVSGWPDAEIGVAFQITDGTLTMPASSA